MKKALLLSAALMFIASGVSAQLIGLYVDAERTSWEATAASGIVYVYVFAQPNTDGMTCLELRTEASNTNFMAFATTWAPDAAEARMGNIPDQNLVGCWTSCKFEWTWLCNAGMFMMSGDELIISIAPYTDQPYPKILDCVDPANELPAMACTPVCINALEPCLDPCDNAVEESTWGAIKNLYE